jgi:methionyl-tRNA formyltransferase
MHISILCSDPAHPVNAALNSWATIQTFGTVEILRAASHAQGGDFLFLISCSEIVKPEVRDRYRHTLVIHASDLPHGRGWSPMVWGTLEGRLEFTVSLLEAGDAVDSGDIWTKRQIRFRGHELFDEINAALFAAEIELMNFAVTHEKTIVPAKQADARTKHYRRRTPEDSRLDPDKSLRDQFDLLRVSDSDRFPAFFELRGHRYEVRLSKPKDKNGRR